LHTLRPDSEPALVRLNRDALLFMIMSGVIFLFSASSSALSSAGNTGIQVFWLATFLNAVLLAALYRVPLHKIWQIACWLLPLMIWIILSAYWSEFPDITLRRAIRQVLEVFSILLLLCTYSYRTEPLRILFLGFATIALLDFASLAVPSFSFSSVPPGFKGFHGHKNSAGEFYFYALPLFGLALFDRSIGIRRYVALLAALCGAALLLLSHSKTAIGLVAVTSLCVFAIRLLRRMRKYAAVLLLIYFLIAATAVVAVLGAGFINTIDFLTGDPTLTGRAELWNYVLARWQENPYFGQGFGALWQVGVQMGAYLEHGALNWVMNEAHNGYLDVLAQTGIIGLLLLIIFLLVALRAALFARTDKRVAFDAWKWYVIYVTIGTILHNITESSWLRSWELFVVLFATTQLPTQSARATEYRRARPAVALAAPRLP
jgi:exopolysaccharide production protein ExoQ